MPFNPLNLLGYSPDSLDAFGLLPADLEAAKKSTLLGVGQGLLAASGPSRMPINWGQAFAQAVGQGQQMGQGALERAMMAKAMREQKAQREAAAQRQAALQAALARGDLAAAAQIDPAFANQYRQATASSAPEGFTLGPDQIRYDAQGKEIARGAPKPIDQAAADKVGRDAAELKFNQEQKLRGEFTGLQSVKDFQVVRDGYSRVANAAINPSPAGDLSLVFGYMKMLDPTSSVREGEYANAANAAGVPERIRTLYKNLVNGEKLGPEQRADFLAQAQRLYQSQYQQVQNLDKTYSDLASQYQVNPDLVTPEFGIPADQLKKFETQIGQAINLGNGVTAVRTK